MDDEHIIVFNKDAKIYPSMWWTMPERHTFEVAHPSHIKDYSLIYYGKFFAVYLVFWYIIYYFYPAKTSFSDVLPGFILGLICIFLWFYYYIDSSMIFFNSETKNYYKSHVPHGRRIILNKHAEFNLGDFAAIIKNTDYKKLRAKLKLSDKDYPTYSNNKMEELVSEGKTNAGLHERYTSLRTAGFNIAFTIFSFGYLLAQYKDKTLITKTYKIIRKDIQEGKIQLRINIKQIKNY